MDYEAEHGTLDVWYPEDKSYQPIAFFRDFATPDDPDKPYFVHNTSTPDGRWLLGTAHTRLVNYLKEVGYNLAPGTIDKQPTQAVIGTWNEAVSWAGAGWHDFKEGGNYTSVEAVDRVIKPFAELNLFVVNEAYSLYQHWSEGTLTMAENVLRKHFNLSVPALMSPETAAAVLYGPDYKEFRGSEE